MNPVFAFAAGIVLGLTSVSPAQSSDEPIVNPSGQVGLKYSESAKTMGGGRLIFSAFGDMGLDNSCIQYVNLPSGPSTYSGFSPLGYQFDIIPALSLGIVNFLDFSAAIPVYMDNVTRYDSLWPGTKSFGGLQAGFGDLEMKLKLQLPPRNGPRVLDMAYLAGVILPTGDKSHGYFPRHTYYFLKDSTQLTPSGDTAHALAGFFSSGQTEIEGKILFTFNCWEHGGVVPLMLHLNLGARIIPARGFDEVLLLAAAVEYRPASWISLYTEASAEPRLASIMDGFAIGNDPLRVSPGFVIHLPEGGFISVGGDWGLSTHDPVGYEAQGTFVDSRLQPEWKVSASIGWTGFLYRTEHSENKKKVAGGDLDNDGIPDSIDKCPQVPEDKDGFEDADGCPDYDNDKDGIADTVDGCPNAAEDYDGYQDKDGCPDPDNDEDGVCDPWVGDSHLESQYEMTCKGVDKCPNLPEDVDGFEDADGCPDYDNDLDGIPDTLDKCPNEAGPADNNGCPKQAAEPSSVKEIKRGRLILRSVEFKAISADLLPESFQKLDEVYESLKAYPDARIEISGYTDNSGNTAANRKLSQRRAEAARSTLYSAEWTPRELRLSAKAAMIRLPITPRARDGRSTDASKCDVPIKRKAARLFVIER